MRNSFSLSVYFLLRCNCDVKIVYKKSDTASGKMKLIPLLILLSTTVDVNSAEHFTFPPKFLPPNGGVLSTSDNSIYLPPESHTSIPYYPMKSENNLPFPYLPVSVTKAPGIYPTPFPVMFSSTLRSIDHDSDEEDDESDEKPHIPVQKTNRTVRSHPDNVEKRDMRLRPNYQPIDRNDMKTPYGFIPAHPSAPMQKATPRSMIVSMEQARHDALDQIRGAAAFQGPQYLPAPGTPGVYISSTTETAIPILRLSNEMDLDGSFSYEALGADQTHYVQHSRMENTGTDKEEQIVEGSYSYVGDNGQTYTVHYIADSKGFRASGDHLPVAPPVPEIIQRAIQFNLAEEAKKPPNLKSWQNDEKENELSETEKYQRFATPPPRPLFTGKTPQSFSFGYAQPSHNTQSNLMSSASTPNSISSNDFNIEQLKSNVNSGGPISPQITFLASQGAHSPNPQQSISRTFTTERTTLPQIVNYEAGIKESDVENNKALWRWQYGLNANINQNSEKNSISRSSGEGDNVIINFSDMTPEQYTKMIKSELVPNEHNDQIAESSRNSDSHYQLPYEEPKAKNDIIIGTKQISSTETPYAVTQVPDSYNNYNNKPYEHKAYQTNENSQKSANFETTYNARPKIITQSDFVPQSHTITQSYDYEESSYEPRRIIKSTSAMPSVRVNNNYNSFNDYERGTERTLMRAISSTVAPVTLPNNNYNSMNSNERNTQNNVWPNFYPNQIENAEKMSTTEMPPTTTTNIRYTDFIVNENKNEFKPIIPSQVDVTREEPIQTTENTIENMFEDNFFFKNLLRNTKNNQNEGNRIKEENKSYPQQKSNVERKPEKVPKYIQMQAKPHNDIKGMAKKPVDIADILNYLSAKNHFESIKMKPKSKYGSNNYNHRTEVNFIPIQHDRDRGHDNVDDDEERMEHSSSQRTSYYHPEELQGMIKNYKVLHRNNSAFNKGQEEHLRRDLSPPAKVAHSNLPPLGRAGPSMKSYLPPTYV